MKKRISTIALIVVFLAGLSLLLYPSVSNWWNQYHSSHAIADYTEKLQQLDSDECARLLRAASAYNDALRKKLTPALTDEERADYEALLNVTGDGIMGHVEIPSIGVSLPIYHGTDTEILQVAVGHLDWTSLPVGGESTHCVLSGHRGLPSASLFTDLDRMVVGDVFTITVLNETLTYEVDRILIVEPEDASALTIEEGRDLCTLLTCTPYGINSHRLLVRGHRIENAAKTANLTADAVQLEPLIVAPVIAMPILLVLLMFLLCTGKKKKPTGGTHHDKTR